MSISTAIRPAVNPGPGPAASAWLAESTVLWLTELAIDLVDDGEPGEAYGIFGTLEEDNAGMVLAFLEPYAATWADWLTLCLAGSPLVPSRPVPSADEALCLAAASFELPGADPDRYEPTPEDEAELLGHRLVMEGQVPDPPKGMPDAWVVAFFQGAEAAYRAMSERELAEERYSRLDEWDTISDHETILSRGLWTDAVGWE